MAKVIQRLTSGVVWKGVKDGAIGGISAGILGLILGPTIGAVAGGVIGAAITGNSIIALNGTMDAIQSVFLSARGGA